MQNEYIKPLSGEPCYRNSGLIYALDNRGDKYIVSRLDFERYDEQNFQYVFSPVWKVIEALPSDIFQGIPGLDMSLHLSQYYRVNMTPYFITERTPGEGREDLWELLEEVGLDYYDRFEWLLRTDKRCGIDNLIVERAKNPRRIVSECHISLPDNLQPDDCVAIKSLENVATTGYQFRKMMLYILRSGASIWNESEKRILSDVETRTMLRLLMIQDAFEKKENRNRRLEGIDKAKKEGKYTGRKKMTIDQNLLAQIAKDFESKKITEAEAISRSGISSRSTFYRRLKELRY